MKVFFILSSGMHRNSIYTKKNNLKVWKILLISSLQLCWKYWKHFNLIFATLTNFTNDSRILSFIMILENQMFLKIKLYEWAHLYTSSAQVLIYTNKFLRHFEVMLFVYNISHYTEYIFQPYIWGAERITFWSFFRFDLVEKLQAVENLWKISNFCYFSKSMLSL